MRIIRSSTEIGTRNRLTQGILMALATMSLAGTTTVMAQDQATDASADSSEAVLEEVIVTGTRQLIQDQISITRDSNVVAVGLSATDIGNLPALSIGEALETLTGVSSHRENGGATEISIRGMGPYLSKTLVNGREASNGSSDRSVNFSMFPSELMNKLVVYKSQDAKMVEGGVSGLISLGTLKPLDYGKRRFQFDLKGNYNPDQQDIKGAMADDIGWRGTLSYVDAFEFRNGGEFGISLGYQHSDTSQPEQEVRGSSPTGSSIWACINEPSVTYTGFFRDSSGDCEDTNNGSGSNQGYNTSIDPDTGKAVDDGKAFAFAPSSRAYRQNDTMDERDALFAAFQWRPNDDWELNLDMQWSNRVQTELRNDFNIANQKRATVGVTGPTLVTNPLGGVSHWEGTTAIESNSETYERDEEYIGGGLNVIWNITDLTTMSADLSYSETVRTEKQVSLRLQSDDQDIYGNNTPGGYRPTVSWDWFNFPQFTLYDFDPNDHALYSDEYRARIDSDVDRTNTITSFRLDFSQATEWGIIESLEYGVRYSELEYLNLGGTRWDPGTIDDSSEAERAAILAMNEACRDDRFPESGFLSSQSVGDPITYVNTETGETTSGSSWGTFDTMCIVDAMLDFHGEEFAWPEQFYESASTTDVVEETVAAYLMANYSDTWFGKEVYGNFGLRVVNSDVSSTAFRTSYLIVEEDGFFSIIEDPNADLEKVAAGDDYTEWLPSFNMVMDLSDEWVLRGGIFRAMSRADPSDMGYNRSFSFTSEEDITNPEDLITSVSGSGNPFIGPLMSWNFDASIEWYPNDDTILAMGVFYKSFEGGFDVVQQLETFLVDGVEYDRPVTVYDVSDDTSTIYGFELTAAHNLNYLDNWLRGFGTKLSLSVAESDFEFEDSNYGTTYRTELDGSKTQLTQGIIAPANLPGFSDIVFSGQLYYGIGNFDANLIYKYRDQYFQPYTSNGTRIRYVEDVGVWEARVSWQFTDHLTLSLEGINLFDEPKETRYYVEDYFGEMNIYGPRYFLGLRGKF
ncbi:MAG: TonB-dependent receptor [Xanthomonadales bacterium]|nr:TonB-dependent receptor [Xanthomonadales bacterium]